MVRRTDMGSLYAKNMSHFGTGLGLYHPVGAVDMSPPCVGYLDSNRRWNHLTNLEWEGDDRPDTRIYTPLEKVPQKMSEVNIEWRPRTSLGVRQYMVDATGETPYDFFQRFLHTIHPAHHRLHYSDGLPAGANATVRYASKTKFGAVLIAQKPVTLTSYNDETLFRHWLSKNRARLAQLHGVELSRYGLWLVTRTYCTPMASINAWEAKDKDANLSVKVKANMMGDLGGDLDWSEKTTDKDWAHYSSPGGVVAFFDGIQIPAWQWWYDGVKARLGKDVGLVKKQMMPNRRGLLPHGSWKPSKHIDPRRQSAPGADDVYAEKCSPIEDPKPREPTLPLIANHETEPADTDLWGSSTPLRGVSPLSARSRSRGRPQSVSFGTPSRNASTLSKPLKYQENDRLSQRDITDPTLRLSTASTAAGNGGSATKDFAIGDIEKDASNKDRHHELRRKLSSPTLRYTSPAATFT